MSGLVCSTRWWAAISRSPRGYDRLAGAYLGDRSDLEAIGRDELARDIDVVAYCRGPYCVYADDAVRRLRAAGYDAFRLEDGFPEWEREGRPTTQ